MKKLIAALLATVMLVSLFACSKNQTDVTSATDNPTETSVEQTAFEDDEEEDEEEEVKVDKYANMIKNPDFSLSDNAWSMYTESGGDGECSVDTDEGYLKLLIRDVGSREHSVQMYYDGIKLKQNAEYLCEFKIWSDVEKTVTFRIQYNGGDYHSYVLETFTATTEPTVVSIPFTMEYESDAAPRICFNCGAAKDGSEDGKQFDMFNIYFDDISVRCTDDSNAAPEVEVYVSDVNINQLGYRPDDSKIAVVRKCKVGEQFDVIDADGKSVYTGTLTGGEKNATAGEKDYYADFSEVNTPGTYKVVTASGKESYEFEIGDDVYSDAFAKVVRMIYLQRCGTELTEADAGEFAHAKCHDGKAIIYGTNDKIDVSGGWHDAGDYGRYVVSGAKAVIDLLLAYDDNPTLFGDDTDIPESGNGIPDVLDEVRWELDWMLKMQREDGGVYHKVTCLDFPDTVMPDEETDQLYCMPVSATATGDFAAVMAHASRTYAEIDPDFAAVCLAAADRAWEYCEANPKQTYKNPSGVTTGEYADSSASDEMYWASCELLAATGDSKYTERIEKCLNRSIKSGLGWADMGGFGTIAYLTMDESLTDPALRQRITDDFIGCADIMVSNCKRDGYFMSLGGTYPWGSNMTVANNAMFLMYASRFSGNDSYCDYARKHMDYLFGVNPMGMSYVTCTGTVSPMNPHHRPSQVAGTSMPGMLVGGPNSNLEDPFAKAVLMDAAPAKCYVDNVQSYSCNEICIYWNSPLIYVMSQCCFD